MTRPHLQLAGEMQSPNPKSGVALTGATESRPELLNPKSYTLKVERFIYKPTSSFIFSCHLRLDDGSPPYPTQEFEMDDFFLQEGLGLELGLKSLGMVEITTPDIKTGYHPCMYPDNQLGVYPENGSSAARTEIAPWIDFIP